MPEMKYKVPSNWISIVFFTLMVAMLYFLYIFPQQDIQKSYEIPYSQFKQLLTQGRVNEVELRGNLAIGVLFRSCRIRSGPHYGQTFQNTDSRNPEMKTHAPDRVARGDITCRSTTGERRWLVQHACPDASLAHLSLDCCSGSSSRASRRISGGLGGSGGELQKFLLTSTKEANVPEVTFDDVAGQENGQA